MVFVEHVRGAVLPPLQKPLEELVKHATVTEINMETHPFHHHQKRRGFEVVSESYIPSRKSLRVKCFLSGGEGQDFYLILGNNNGHDPEIIKGVIDYLVVLNERYKRKF